MQQPPCTIVRMDENIDCNVMGGVFVDMMDKQADEIGELRRTHSLKTLSSNVTEKTASQTSLFTPASSWKTSGTTEHNRNAPLIVSDPEDPNPTLDQAAALGRILERSRHLPSTGQFASNHIMVNKERTKRTIAPLFRLRELDQIAREHAEEMAARDTLFHTTPDDLQAKFHRPARRLGENVSKGEAIADIHQNMMMTLAHKNNILDRRYTHMGMATARGSDGNLYLCQVFRG